MAQVWVVQATKNYSVEGYNQYLKSIHDTEEGALDYAIRYIHYPGEGNNEALHYDSDSDWRWTWFPSLDGWSDGFTIELWETEP